MKRRFVGMTALFMAALMLCAACSDTKPHESGLHTDGSTVSSSVSETSESALTSATTMQTTMTPVSVSDVSPPVESTEPTTEGQTTEIGETAEPDVTTTAAAPPVKTTTTAPPVTTVTTKPVVPVVVPVIKNVSSPMTNAQVEATAVVDYSNISCGYISARYSGASKRAKLRIICGSVVNDHDLNTDGVFEYYPLTEGSGEYSIQLYEQLEGKKYTKVISVTVSAVIADEVSPYSYPNRYVMYDQGSACVYKAAEVCAGISNTIEKIAAIFGYITDNITYDNDLASKVSNGTVGVYVPDPDRVLASKKGICFDYASLFAAMLRSQGIPSRLVIGYAKENIYHAWNEVYTTETGWISAELLLKKMGYNIVDSTFYANTSDKPGIAAYIMDSSNYSAIYRY